MMWGYLRNVECNGKFFVAVFVANCNERQRTLGASEIRVLYFLQS